MSDIAQARTLKKSGTFFGEPRALAYLAFIPLSWRNFRDKFEESAGPEATLATTDVSSAPTPDDGASQPTSAVEEPPKTTGRIFTLRSTDQPK